MSAIVTCGGSSGRKAMSRVGTQLAGEAHPVLGADAVEHRLLVLARRGQVVEVAENPDAAGGAAPASAADMSERDAVQQTRLEHAQAPLRPDRPVGKGQADRADPALPPAADAADEKDAGQRPGQEDRRCRGGPQRAGRCPPPSRHAPARGSRPATPDRRRGAGSAARPGRSRAGPASARAPRPTAGGSSPAGRRA